mmetsp:Transcript_32127/g.63302  ORF Transcript_32127/g.63302 Transcript_32127/m.63302 type:complete len:82 (-) Transcript_32127:222-467(-)
MRKSDDTIASQMFTVESPEAAGYQLKLLLPAWLQLMQPLQLQQLLQLFQLLPLLQLLIGLRYRCPSHFALLMDLLALGPLA